MSYEVVRWAMYDSPTLLTAKGIVDSAAWQVLVALAEAAHSDGTMAYPSIHRLCQATRLGPRAVTGALGRLVDASVIRLDGVGPNDAACWTLDMSLTRDTADRQRTQDRAKARRRATADRVRRLRARKDAAGDVAETAGGSGEQDIAVSNPDLGKPVDNPAVTPSEGVTAACGQPPCNAVGGRYVTPSEGVTRTDVTPSQSVTYKREPSFKEERSCEPSSGGTLPPDPLRPHSPAGSGTGQPDDDLDQPGSVDDLDDAAILAKLAAVQCLDPDGYANLRQLATASVPADAKDGRARYFAINRATYRLHLDDTTRSAV